MKTTIKQVMSDDPVMIRPEQNIQEAAQLMKEIDSGILPVGDPFKVIGMITDRDIAIRVVAPGRDPLRTKVSDVMTPQHYSCETDDNLEIAAERMRKHDISRLLVTDGRKVVGIVTLADLLRAGGKEKLSDEVLHELLYVKTDKSGKKVA